MTNEIKYLKEERGFTIVELLIVIVIIAILAAIAIVAYNGIQARANTSAASSTATNTRKKVEIYNTDIGNYPVTFATLTGAASTTLYKLQGVASTSTALSNTTPTNTIDFEVCGSGSPANLAAITTSNVTGIKMTYRDYSGSTNTTLTSGTTSGGTVLCYDSTGAAT